jgi:hypothetical protein
MADNLDITQGTGTTVAADDIGGVKYQRVKLSLGADGTANDASAGAGAVGTGTQRVTLASDDPAVVALTASATSLPHTATDATNDLSYVFDSSSASGERDLVSATALMTTRGYRFTITAAGATTVEFRDGASGTVLFTVEFPGAGAFVYDFDPRPYFKTTANTKLVRNSTNAVKVAINLGYLKN